MKPKFEDYKVSLGKIKWIDVNGKRATEWVACNKLMWGIGLSLVAIILLILFTLHSPSEIDQVGKTLKPLSEIIPVLSLFFAIGAIVIALMSYKSSVLRPHLKLRFAPYQQTSMEVQLSINEQERVAGGRPLSEWEMWLENDGESSAKHPMVRIFFQLINHEGRYFGKKEFPGWEAVSHAYGRGYCGFQWSYNNEILYPGFSVKLPTLYMLGKHIEGDFFVEIAFVADGAPKTTACIPVKVSKIDKLKQDTGGDFGGGT